MENCLSVTKKGRKDTVGCSLKGKKRFACLYPKEDLIMSKSKEKGASRKDGNEFWGRWEGWDPGPRLSPDMNKEVRNTSSSVRGHVLLRMLSATMETPI